MRSKMEEEEGRDQIILDLKINPDGLNGATKFVLTVLLVGSISACLAGLFTILNIHYETVL